MNNLLNEFIAQGGVITLYSSDDERRPLRFSLKFRGKKRSGKATNLTAVLERVMDQYNNEEEHNIDPLDDAAMADIYGYDGPFF